jgi:hypothetical protein
MRFSRSAAAPHENAAINAPVLSSGEKCGGGSVGIYSVVGKPFWRPSAMAP